MGIYKGNPERFWVPFTWCSPMVPSHIIIENIKTGKLTLVLYVSIDPCHFITSRFMYLCNHYRNY